MCACVRVCVAAIYLLFLNCLITSKTFELRREQNKPANLTHVLLSLVFDHSRQEVIGEFRYAFVNSEQWTCYV